MNSKSILAVSLFISFFVAGNIIIFGIAKSFFIPTYFLFCFFFLVILIYSLKNNFKKDKDLYFALFIAFIITLFAAYTAAAAFNYLEKKQEFLNQNQTLKFEIENLTSTNDYSLNYIEYLKDQIQIAKENSEDLQDRINDFISAGSQTTPLTRGVIEREDEEHELEEEDD